MKNWNLVAVGAVVGVAVIYCIDRAIKTTKLKRLKRELNAEFLALDGPIEHSEEIIREQLSRNYAFLGEEA